MNKSQIINELMNMVDTEELVKLAENRNTPKEMLIVLGEHSSDSVLMELALNVNTPNSVLIKLQDDGSFENELSQNNSYIQMNNR